MEEGIDKVLSSDGKRQFVSGCIDLYYDFGRLTNKFHGEFSRAGDLADQLFICFSELGKDITDLHRKYYSHEYREGQR